MNDYCGTRVASYIYDAYGNHKVLDKNKEENKAKNFIGNMNPIRYKGYYYDVETGLFFATLDITILSGDVFYKYPISVH